MNKVQNALPPLLTQAEVAVMLGVSISTVYRIIKRGELEATVLSPRNIRISRRAVEDYLTQKGGEQ